MIARELRPPPVPVAPLAEDERERAEPDAAPQPVAEGHRRLREVIDRHYDFVWRTVRNFGVDEASAEDGAQQVLCVLARRLADVAPGAEMSFLFATAMRVASDMRRAARRALVVPLESVDELVAMAPSAEELVDEGRAREVLRRVLDALPLDLRVVFVLFELEELTAAQIAALIGVPPGTVASRLRRAREAFQAIVRRLHAAQRSGARGGRR